MSKQTVAVAIDALEPSLAQAMMDKGKLPHLREISLEGGTSSVTSWAHIGSGSVWPTFLHGVPPSVHGTYSEWMWDPARMDVRRWTASELPTFWESPASGNSSAVGILDVPFTPLRPPPKGFLVSEWGAHDVLNEALFYEPDQIEHAITEVPRHPFGNDPPTIDQHQGLEAIDHLVSASIKGVALRTRLIQELLEAQQPDVSILCYPELHHIAHYVWHHESRSGDESTPARQVLESIDDAVGELRETVPHDSFVVFSLHGFKGALGIVDLLPTVLEAAGFARPKRWRDMDRTTMRTAALQAVKQRAPESLKKLYHQRTSTSLQRKVARAGVLQPLDWARTTAFALPTDQHGWVRINMAGREREGIVPPGHYLRIRDDIMRRLRQLTDDVGTALVDSVTASCASPEEAMTSGLPDIVVRWTAVAHEESTMWNGQALRRHAAHVTGQHDAEGIFLATGALGNMPDRVAADELGHLLVSSAGGDE